MLLVGLTGNYGMGKSTILKMFEKFGAIAIDTDEIVRSLLLERRVIEKVREILGDEVFNQNGSLNKEKVANIIFKNIKIKNLLEDLLHPLVFEKINSFLRQINNKDKIIIVEIPLLFEKGYEDLFDKKITVYTTEDIALGRLEAKGINRQEAKLRLKSQLPIQQKIENADFVIDNSGSISDTEAQVQKIFNELLRGAENGDNKRFRGIK